MRELSVEEAKKYELDILLDVAKFCDENGLRYYLAYGTLIGAVRHKGFIPWDDDIDIQMPREDYEVFLEKYNKTSSCYKAIDPYEECAKHSYVKVIDTRTIKIEKYKEYKENMYLGIDIDIFPVDGQPETYRRYSRYFRKKQIILAIFEFFVVRKYYNNFLLEKTANFVGNILTKLHYKKRVLDKLKKINSPYKYDECTYVGATDSLYNYKKDRTLKKNYESYVLVDFEGYKFKAPAGYHEILTNIYGDYMQLPPEEQRVTHHGNKMMLKENVSI